MIARGSPLGMWAAGLRIGVGAIRKEPVLGLKRLVLPVSYWRTAEFGYVYRRLHDVAAGRLLDIGSPKELALLLARYRSFAVVATDILPEAVALSQRYADAQGLGGDGPGRVRSEAQDGRSLEYPDDSFDAAFSVSVLEHIPDVGDSAAIGEMIRVIKPGGVVVVTVPFSEQYRETWVDRSVYERRQVDGKPVFYERHYDRRTLAERLWSAHDAEVIDVEWWGEAKARAEAFLLGLGTARAVVSPLEPLLAGACLRRVHPGDGRHAMAAFFTLRKHS